MKKPLLIILFGMILPPLATVGLVMFLAAVVKGMVSFASIIVGFCWLLTIFVCGVGLLKKKNWARKGHVLFPFVSFFLILVLGLVEQYKVVGHIFFDFMLVSQAVFSIFWGGLHYVLFYKISSVNDYFNSQ